MSLSSVCFHHDHLLLFHISFFNLDAAFYSSVSMHFFDEIYCVVLSFVLQYEEPFIYFSKDFFYILQFSLILYWKIAVSFELDITGRVKDEAMETRLGPKVSNILCTKRLDPFYFMTDNFCWDLGFTFARCQKAWKAPIFVMVLFRSPKEFQLAYNVNWHVFLAACAISQSIKRLEMLWCELTSWIRDKTLLSRSDSNESYML